MILVTVGLIGLLAVGVYYGNVEAKGDLGVQLAIAKLATHNSYRQQYLCTLFKYSIVPSSGLYFNLNGTIYLSGNTISITDVGDSFLNETIKPDDPGPSLVCVTSNVNTKCCRADDHPGIGGVGNWLYPDGNTVPGNSNNTNGFTRSYHFQQLRLNRKRHDIMFPFGVFTCVVRDGSNTSVTHRANITLSEDSTMSLLFQHRHFVVAT